jgi:hypothetical protein
LAGRVPRGKLAEATMEAEMCGHCTCGAARYEMLEPPLFVHCCHCTWCQRETGTAFALNAMIETDRLAVTGAVEPVMLPSASGRGQEVVRCAACKVALFSHYGGGRLMAFVRVGTMEAPAACPPDVHIYTSTRLPWVTLPKGARVFEAYYDPRQEWPEAAQGRFRAMKARAAG